MLPPVEEIPCFYMVLKRKVKPSAACNKQHLFFKCQIDVRFSTFYSLVSDKTKNFTRQVPPGSVYFKNLWNLFEAIYIDFFKNLYLNQFTVKSNSSGGNAGCT